MTHCYWKAALLVVVGVELSVTDLRAQQKPKESLAEIVDAWKQRQARVQSARFAWTEAKIVGGGKHTAFGGLPLQPPEDTLVKNKVRISFDTDRLIYQYDGWGWQGDKGRMVPDKYIGTFDGAVNKLYWPPLETRQQGEGIVEKRDTHPNEGNVFFRALILAYRPFHMRMGALTINNYDLLDSYGVINGRTCNVLEDKGSELRRSVWTDPARDHVPVKYLEAVGEKKAIFLETEYDPHPEVGWVPKQWKMTWINSDGSLNFSAVATVDKYDINVPLDKSEFEVNFDKGTTVEDRVDRQVYDIMPDGTKQIHTTSPPPANFSTVLWFVLAANAIFVCTLVFAWAWRKRRGST